MPVNGAADPSGLIAIIGIGCRLPDADSPELFFENLAAGHDAVRRSGAGPDATGLVHAFGALDGLEDFDAAFFRIIPRHAELLCPQHRLLLECAWAALEGAGYAPDAAPGSVGVFVAAARSGYRHDKLRSDAERLVAEAALGQDYAATRISHKLNLRGPSLSVQTASSASLVAVHFACEALLGGQCDMALAGGAAVTLPQSGYRHDPSLMFAADGCCRPFDARASGAVPGNGAALVLLKPLAAARAAGDPVIAVVRASAVNNDGAGKVDFYAPSQDGQEAVLREALAVAGLSPAAIGYVEAHGTGTALGDPIEIAALASVFGTAGLAPGSVGLGSVKSSVGHLHCAAGIAGLVKAALMLRHRTLVPSLHFAEPNPRSVLAESPFAVCTDTRPWPAPPGGGPRRAGVSSFGIGGTNAHLILEEAPEPPARAPGPSGTWHVFPLSARSPAVLAAMRSRLAEHIEAHPSLELRDVSATLREGRTVFAHRAAPVAADRAGLLSALRGEAAAAPLRQRSPPRRAPSRRGASWTTQRCRGRATPGGSRCPPTRSSAAAIGSNKRRKPLRLRLPPVRPRRARPIFWPSCGRQPAASSASPSMRWMSRAAWPSWVWNPSWRRCWPRSCRSPRDGPSRPRICTTFRRSQGSPRHCRTGLRPRARRWLFRRPPPRRRRRPSPWWAWPGVSRARRTSTRSGA